MEIGKRANSTKGFSTSKWGKSKHGCKERPTIEPIMVLHWGANHERITDWSRVDRGDSHRESSGDSNDEGPIQGISRRRRIWFEEIIESSTRKQRQQVTAQSRRTSDVTSIVPYPCPKPRTLGALSIQSYTQREATLMEESEEGRATGPPP